MPNAHHCARISLPRRQGVATNVTLCATKEALFGIGIKIDDHTLQHTLLVHAPRINCQRTPDARGAFAFVDVPMQR